MPKNSERIAKITTVEVSVVEVGGITYTKDAAGYWHGRFGDEMEGEVAQLLEAIVELDGILGKKEGRYEL